MILKAKMKSEDLKTKTGKKNISEKVPNDDNAYRITERLAFPRLIGSEGEIKAREIVVEEFKKAGYHLIQRDKFKTSFYNMILIRFIFVILGIALIPSSIPNFVIPEKRILLLNAVTLIVIFIISIIIEPDFGSIFIYLYIAEAGGAIIRYISYWEKEKIALYIQIIQ